MKTISHILILVFIVSIYVSYCQWQSSRYYALSAAMQMRSDWPKMLIFAVKAAKANPLDDKPLHLVIEALLRQDRLKPAILLIKKVLSVRPYKKYLLRNLKVAMENLKVLQSKEGKAKQ